MAANFHIYSTVPDGLVELLSEHLPYSVPVLRRLQFTRFPGGITPTSRIIVAAEYGEFKREPQKFAVAYLDFSRGPETEMWMYSTLEDGDMSDADRSVCEEQIVAVVSGAKQVSREYNEKRAYPGEAILGAVHSAVRDAMERCGVGITQRGPWHYEKWLFELDKLPDSDPALPEGMRWDTASAEDCEVVVARSTVPRTTGTLSLLPGSTIKLEDGTPIAWSFLGLDGSLTSLHCEEPYRRRGLSKILAARLFRQHSSKFGPDRWCAADVAPDNLGSVGMCKSLNGKRGWNVSWVMLKLDDNGEDNTTK